MDIPPIALEWREDGYVLKYGGKETLPFTKLYFNKVWDGEETKVDELEGLLNQLEVPDGEKNRVASEVLKIKLKVKQYYPLVWLGRHPEVYDIYMKHESRWVKHDDLTKQMVFLTALSAYSPNPINLFVRGPSSSGKTYVVMQTVKYIPQRDVWLLGGLSPTSLYHDYGRYYDEDGNEIDMREIDWKDAADRARMDRAKYVVDLSYKVLVFLEAPHYETYMKLRPILSHDAYEIRYAFTEKTKSGYMRTKHVYLRGWPATIFCTTSTQYQEELATRSVNITPEMTEAKYRDSVLMQGDRIANPWRYENPDPMMHLLRKNLEDIRSKMQEFLVVVPYGEELSLCYPHDQPRDMRDFSKLTTMIQQCAYLRIFQRPWLDGADYEGKRIVLATPRDFRDGIGLFSYIAETTRSGLPGNVISFFNEVLVQLSNKQLTMSYNDISDKWMEVYKTSRSKETLKKVYVNPLVQAGWADEDEDPNDKRRKYVRILRGPEQLLTGFEDQFKALLTPARIEKWAEDLRKEFPNARVLVSGEEIPWEEFAYDYFEKWS